MKTNIFRIGLLSVFVLLVLVFLAPALIQIQITPAYFLAVIFFFIIYTIQSFIITKLKKQPGSFVTAYTFLSAVKMFLSFVFIATYLALSKNQDEHGQITFLVYFLIIYFLFLIINVTGTFRQNMK